MPDPNDPNSEAPSGTTAPDSADAQRLLTRYAQAYREYEAKKARHSNRSVLQKFRNRVSAAARAIRKEGLEVPTLTADAPACETSGLLPAHDVPDTRAIDVLAVDTTDDATATLNEPHEDEHTASKTSAAGHVFAIDPQLLEYDRVHQAQPPSQRSVVCDGSNSPKGKSTTQEEAQRESLEASIAAVAHVASADGLPTATSPRNGLLAELAADTLSDPLSPLTPSTPHASVNDLLSFDASFSDDEDVPEPANNETLFSEDEDDAEKFAKDTLSAADVSMLLENLQKVLSTLQESQDTLVRVCRDVQEKDNAWNKTKDDLSSAKQAHLDATAKFSSLYSRYKELSGKKLTVSKDVYQQAKGAAKDAQLIQDELSKRVDELVVAARERQTERDELVQSQSALELAISQQHEAAQCTRDKYERLVGPLPDEIAAVLDNLLAPRQTSAANSGKRKRDESLPVATAAEDEPDDGAEHKGSKRIKATAPIKSSKVTDAVRSEFMKNRTHHADLLVQGEAILRGAMWDKCYKHHYNRNGLAAYEKKYGGQPGNTNDDPARLNCGCPVDVAVLDVMAYKGQPESQEDPQLAGYKLPSDEKAFTNLTVDCRLAYLRLLLNSTKTRLDELLRPPIVRKCNIIANLLASLRADLEAENLPEDAQRISELEVSFTATAQAAQWSSNSMYTKDSL